MEHKLTPEALASLPVSDLFSLALTMSDDDDGDAPGWNAISELHKRGTDEIFALARFLCQAINPHKRAVGVNILGQLGWPEKYPFKNQTLPILFQLMQTDSNIEVLQSACTALGHLHDERTIEPLLQLKNHPHEDVRHGVVFGLLGFDDERAINALIELSKDNDPSVRDWATFGLGQQINVNTEAIRQALYERLNDSDETTQGEALVGLARRNDKRVTPLVLAQLEQMPYWSLPLEAAEALADPALLSALYQFKASWDREQDWIYNELIRAIAACEGRPVQK